jgi:hypothetical protein
MLLLYFFPVILSAAKDLAGLMNTMGSFAALRMTLVLF